MTKGQMRRERLSSKPYSERRRDFSQASARHAVNTSAKPNYLLGSVDTRIVDARKVHGMVRTLKLCTKASSISPQHVPAAVPWSATMATVIAWKQLVPKPRNSHNSINMICFLRRWDLDS